MTVFPGRCECKEPGHCPYHGRVMTEGMWRQCNVNPRFRRRGLPMAETPPQKRRARLRLPCINLGKRQLPPADPNGVACGCPGKEVWSCDVHGRCTKGQAFPGVACCNGCPDYETDAAPFTRHLCYHVYPVSNGVWRRNVEMLRARLQLFDGVIVVAVVTDPPTGRKPDPTGPFPPDRGRHIPGCDSFEDVVEAFGDDAKRIEFIHRENDPELREVATLIPMLERIPGGPRDVVLYAQAKGTTRHPGHIAHHWARVMYEVYLDYWHVVEKALENYPCVGAFKKLGPGWQAEQTKSDWHYSGSFSWYRCADLFARDWRKIGQWWSAIESWPSEIFECAEAACIFHEAKVPKMNLYSGGYWKRIVDPALAKWKAEHAR